MDCDSKMQWLAIFKKQGDLIIGFLDKVSTEASGSLSKNILVGGYEFTSLPASMDPICRCIFNISNQKGWRTPF
jgi:hypothetical protein